MSTPITMEELDVILNGDMTNSKAFVVTPQLMSNVTVKPTNNLAETITGTGSLYAIPLSEISSPTLGVKYALVFYDSLDKNNVSAAYGEVEPDDIKNGFIPVGAKVGNMHIGCIENGVIITFNTT